MKYENTPGLRLDDEHKYWDDLGNLPGVNEVEGEAGLETDEYFTEVHSSRGTAVHVVLAGLAQGLDFDWDMLHADLHGWVRSGIVELEIMKDEGARVLGVEVMRAHPLYRFAGTCDLVIDGWRGSEWILDYKTGAVSKATRFKLAAYDMLLGPTANGKPRKKAAVVLDRNGHRAKIVTFNDAENLGDAARFLSHLTTVRDAREYGPKKKT